MDPEEQLLEDGMRATVNFHQRMAALGLVVIRQDEYSALKADKTRMDYLEREMTREQLRLADGKDPGVSLFRMNVPITRALVDDHLPF